MKTKHIFIESIFQLQLLIISNRLDSKESKLLRSFTMVFLTYRVDKKNCKTF